MSTTNYGNGAYTVRPLPSFARVRYREAAGRARGRDDAARLASRGKGQGTVENRVPEIDVMAGEEARGIIVLDGAHPEVRPQIAAFVWGGKVRPVPTLPFGRWKPSPA